MSEQLESSRSGQKYIGNELELFALATNWKRYWSSQVRWRIGPRVLDVGAGLGATTRLLHSDAQARWVALEPDSNLAERMMQDAAAGRFPRACEVRVGTIADMAADELFDTILYIDVLEHISDDREELQRAAAHLDAKGIVVVLAPAHQSLYSPFDKAIGHFRRYDRKMVHALDPIGLKLEVARYLDSFGLCASLGNRLVLRSAMPTASQIRLWDRWMVPISRYVDPLTGWQFGKSVLAIWRKA